MRKEISTSLMLIVIGSLVIPLALGGSNIVTGGGWIGDVKKTFGFVAMGKGGELEYNDHDAGVRIHGIVNPNSLTICGNQGSTTFTNTIGLEFSGVYGASNTFTVCVSDNGEPGKDIDTFSIKTSTGYSASGTLKGGNIQIK